MKQSVVIWVFVAVLVSCGRPSIKTGHAPSTLHQSLSTIDSLMWKQPDSAFAMLLEFVESPKADSLDAFNDHYCQLLISELLYKNNYEQSNREDLLRAMDYFDTLAGTKEASLQRDVFLSARAHYMNGVGYYEMDSVVPALDEYLKVLETMENNFAEKDLKGQKAQFMSLIYNRLGELFSSQYMTKPSIVCLEKAFFFCRIESTSPQAVSNILYQTGKQYDVLGERERANAYYKHALLAVPNKNRRVYRDILTSKALCDYNLGKGLDLFLSVMRPVLVNVEKEEERLNRLLVIGGVFYEEQAYDSALVYLEPVYEKKSDLEAKMIAAEYLRVIYDRLGEKEKKDECVSFLAEQKKMGGDDKTLVSRLEDTFKNYLNRKEVRQAAKEKRSAALQTGIIGFIVIVLVVLAVVVIGRQMHRAQRAALSGRLKQSNQKIRELQYQIEQQEKVATTTPERAVSFTEEPVCRFIMECVAEGRFKSNIDFSYYKKYALDKQLLQALRVATDRHYGRFTSRLKQAYPELTKGDIDYCCLYLLGLTNADVAALMQRAYNTVVERKGKIKKILGVEDDLSAALRSLADSFLSN